MAPCCLCLAPCEAPAAARSPFSPQPCFTALAAGWFLCSPFAGGEELSSHLCLSQNYRLFFSLLHTSAPTSFHPAGSTVAQTPFASSAGCEEEQLLSLVALSRPEALRTWQHLCPAFVYCRADETGLCLPGLCYSGGKGGGLSSTDWVGIASCGFTCSSGLSHLPSGENHRGLVKYSVVSNERMCQEAQHTANAIFQ